MLYENLVSAAFSAKVRQVAASLKINSDWLMMVMYNESRFNPAATNSIGAVGLIQFIPSTYQKWGYTKGQLQAMSALDQLDLVERFYSKAKGKFSSYPDLHLYAFFPAALGKPDSWVLETSTLPATTVAAHNPGFDLNKDSKITVGEYKQRVYERTVERVGKGVTDQLFNVKKQVPVSVFILIAIIVIIILIWINYKYQLL